MSSRFEDVVDEDYLKGLINETYSISIDSEGNITSIVKYTYNEKGQRIKITISFSYDDQGNVKEITKNVETI